jgi:PAS domain S-box-containing protein
MELASAANSQDSERQLQSLKFALDQHAIVSIADASGNIIFVNEKFCQVSKYRSDELIGKNHRVLKSGVHNANFFIDMWNTISSGEVWHGEICNRNKLGELYWVESTIVPFLDAQGLPYQYISIRTEVTQIKQTEEMLAASKAELENINATLETKVKERTEEVRRAMVSIEAAHDKLKNSFINSIRIFSHLIEMREGVMVGHSRRVAELSRNIALRMGMGEEEVQNIFLAALLHNIGRIGLPDHVLEKPFTALTIKERSEVQKHPIRGQLALMSLEELHGAAKLIRSYHERIDGLGYPDKLADSDIPLGSRILALADDYDAVQAGRIIPKHMSSAEAIDFIRKGKGTRYDPAVVDVFMKLMGENNEGSQPKTEIILHSRQLKPGMVISRDLASRNGELLLAKECILDEQSIEQLIGFERISGDLLNIHIHANC